MQERQYETPIRESTSKKKGGALVLEIKARNVVYIFMEGGMTVLCGE